MGTSYDHTDDSYFDDQALAAATAPIKATPGILRCIVATNRNAAARYLLIFDTTAAQTPIRAAFLIPATGQLVVGADVLGPAGMKLSTGITFGISTSSSTYSAATSTEHDVFARYR